MSVKNCTVLREHDRSISEIILTLLDDNYQKASGIAGEEFFCSRFMDHLESVFGPALRLQDPTNLLRMLLER